MSRRYYYHVTSGASWERVRDSGHFKSPLYVADDPDILLRFWEEYRGRHDGRIDRRGAFMGPVILKLDLAGFRVRKDSYFRRVGVSLPNFEGHFFVVEHGEKLPAIKATSDYGRRWV